MNIAVYCGSDFGNQDVYKRAATELGKWIGKNNHTLVYGGGESGLMGAVAKEVHEAGSTVIGVFQKPSILFNRNSFYEPLKTMFTQMEQAGFWWKESMRHVLFSDDLEEISAFIETWDDVK